MFKRTLKVILFRKEGRVVMGIDFIIQSKEWKRRRKVREERM